MNAAERDDPRRRASRPRIPNPVVRVVCVVRAALAVLGLLVTLLGCSPVGPTDSAGPAGSSGSAPAGAGPSGARTRASTPSSPSPPGRSTSPVPARSPSSRTPDRPSCAGSAGSPEVPDRLSLAGRRGSAFAFAPLDRPGDVTVEGRVSGAAAWSTSKVLIVAAYLDTAIDGRPERITAGNRRLITAALARSDETAVNLIRNQIGARPGPAMTSVLRSIGDKATRVPDSYLGTMVWSIREQVRFMAALHAGRVVSPAASRYLLGVMRPIAAHSWGLGRIGATAYKGGWLRADTPTRQMGIVDGYAVAIITTKGPAVRQSDGDAAHVQQLNRLAGQLQQRLDFEKACR